MSTNEARERQQEAWRQRIKHGHAARAWQGIVLEQPARAEVSRILADWMAAYEAADWKAEERFRELAERAGEEGGG